MITQTMIAGKTHDEIISMENWTRWRWYKIILPEEKEEAMKILADIKSIKLKASWTPERKAEHSKAITGENHPFFGELHTEEAKTRQSMAKMGDKNYWYGKSRPQHSEAITGEKHPMYGKKGKDNPNFGSIRSEETKVKMRGENNPMYGRTGEKNPMYKIPRSEETISKIKVAWIPEKRAKQSVALSGKNHYNWQDGKSYEPYCSAFNNGLREYIRNSNNRICTICGKSTLQNINKDGKWLGRLAVDHVDENKMQGCDNWEWRLTPLCPSCHGKMQNKENHLLLQLLLLNNKRHQTNFLFEDSKVIDMNYEGFRI